VPRTLEIGRLRGDPAEEQEGRLAVADKLLSRVHLRLERHPGGCDADDAGSLNGTFLDGCRLEGRVRLTDGNLLIFGGHAAMFRRVSEDALRAIEEELATPFGPVPTASPALALTLWRLRRLARSGAEVLITGETGTGKEVYARAIHGASKRTGRLVAINCAAIPAELAESELFGHARGAHSTANEARPGLIQAADGGTVFLDEIGDLPSPIQPKLLRVLETQRLLRIGSVNERPIDVRVVTATHRDLAAEARVGRFRQDLFYRLSAAMVQVPPLRARHREIPLLARRFLEAACLGLGRPPLKIGSDALDRLVAHDWPGNVRELKNLMEYVAAVVDGSLSGAEVSAALTKSASLEPAPAARPTALPHDLRAAKEELERRSIDAALQASGGNKTRAARMLQMPLRTLMWKLKRFGARGED